MQPYRSSLHPVGMQSNKTKSRQAGLIYFILVITGIFSLMYVPSQLIDTSDIAGTFKNIQENEFLFRIGIVVEMVSFLSFMALPFALYRLFVNEGNKNLGIVMIALVMVSLPITFLNISHKFNILTLIGDHSMLASMGMDQIHIQLFLELKAYFKGVHVSELFWGLWLFPYGLLWYRSGILPKFFGVFLILGSALYVFQFIGSSLFTNYHDHLLAGYVTIPASIGEIGGCLWLLVAGARNENA